ncbi:hypothetical protein [Azonexus sp. R2A61]|uniref:hypothetical protein n=1 Tax=Azonexus sp. R2A61 TaxID=2744443 RepID=UPI001F2FE64C|nr:hypothetical protein [Azonexus sp. R2A61]
MAEPIAPTLTSTGLIVLGVATGLDPMQLLAGFIGCWWYNTYVTPPLPIVQRLTSGILAALVAAWVTPPVLAWVTGSAWWPAHVPRGTVGLPLALAAGFLTHRVLGPALLRLAQKKVEDIAS